MQTHKISFCTVSMNRLHHLMQTVPKNILDNQDYPNIEFVLLDYNSNDGLEEWVKSDLSEHIESGLLKYYRTTKPQYFDRSHSRNLMFKLATGEIIVNIDADNFTGKGFAKYVNETFNLNPNTLIIPDTKKEFYYLRDALGRFCAKKTDFLAISGYDEVMTGYGFEDDDLYERLFTLGLNVEVIKQLDYLNAIKHDNTERIKNEYYKNNLDTFLICYNTPEESEVIILYKDHTYDRGIIIPNNLNTPAPVLIKSNQWNKGKWQKNESDNSIVLDTIEFLTRNGVTGNFIYQSSLDKLFYKINDAAFLESMSYSLPMITNQGKYLTNRKNSKNVNPKGFGKGEVCLNFSENLINVF